MTEYAEPLVREVFASPFADDQLFVQRLGGSKSDPRTIERYLALPVRWRPEVSFFFDRDFYLRQYPDIATADLDPLVHFIGWGAAERRTPHPLINIEYIVSKTPDLLPEPIAVDTLHRILSQDLTDPSPFFSLDFYKSQLAGSKIPDRGLLRHFLQDGLLRGLKPIPSFDPIASYRWAETKSFDIRSTLQQIALSDNAATDQMTEAQAKALFRAKANTIQITTARSPLRFDISGKPDVSVIMVVHNNFALTLLALSSLRANYPGPIELILIDSGSTDETRHLAQYVTGATVLPFDTNISFVHGCNAGLAVVTGDVVLFLNNDIELTHGTVAASLDRLASDPAIGAVGGKIIRPHGVLQEAGCIIWRDGWTAGYLRDKSPLTPEANFVRDVDFCSAAFLLARTSLVQDLGGFDKRFAPAYFEDTDLCIRIRQAGYRIVYDPAVVVYHLEYGTSQDATAAQQRIDKAHHIFYEKHQDRLTPAFASGNANHLFARATKIPGKRILLIEDQLPLRRLGSGFTRSNDIIRLMAGLGHHVTVFPMHPNTRNLAAVYADFPDTAEIIHDQSLKDLPQFLEHRHTYYNTIWIARSHNLDLLRPILEQIDPAGQDRPPVVLDTEAIVAAREAQRHAIQDASAPFDLPQSLRHELRNASFCQSIIAVNANEAALLHSLGLSNIHILGHLRSLALTPRDFSLRTGLLFVGAIHTTDSPNLDSLRWFADHVLPLIEQQLGYQAHLTIAGHIASDIDVGSLRHHPRISLRGPIADMRPLYDANRVFIAPTRYAAGMPYKIHEAASFGVPVVATELLCRQLGWETGQDLLTADQADPAAFASQVVALYRSEALWNRLRTNASRRIRTECSREMAEHAIAEILR